MTAAAQNKTKRRLPEQVTLNRRRYYDLHDGTKLPSVTTILAIAINKPALPGWAAKTVAEEALTNLPRLVKMSRTRRDEAVSWLKGRPYAQRDDAAAAGTAAHQIAEAHVLGQPYPMPDPDSPAGQTLAQFVRFLADWEPQFEATEAVCANLDVGYAGTLDAIATLPMLGNQLLVVDYKTGRTGPYPEWALQIAAYARAQWLWLRDGTKVPMPAVDGAVILRLRPESYGLYRLDADLDDLVEVFAAAAVLAGWMQDADTAGPFSARLAIPDPDAVEN